MIYRICSKCGKEFIGDTDDCGCSDHDTTIETMPNKEIKPSNKRKIGQIIAIAYCAYSIIFGICTAYIWALWDEYMRNIVKYGHYPGGPPFNFQHVFNSTIYSVMGHIIGTAFFPGYPLIIYRIDSTMSFATSRNIVWALTMGTVCLFIFNAWAINKNRRSAWWSLLSLIPCAWAMIIHLATTENKQPGELK